MTTKNAVPAIEEIEGLIHAMESNIHSIQTVHSGQKADSCFFDLTVTDKPDCNVSRHAMLGGNADASKWYRPSGWIRDVLKEYGVTYP